jgi:hypothetical protein
MKKSMVILCAITDPHKGVANSIFWAGIAELKVKHCDGNRNRIGCSRIEAYDT